MRRDRPSSTAILIALWRGMAGVEEPLLAPDAIAERLVPAPYRQALALARRAPRVSGAVLRLADRIARGRIRHMAFRTRAIDDVVTDAIAARVGQVVVLGAGLDARAWRLPALRCATAGTAVPAPAPVIVFEVDHPATQAYKRARTRALAPCAPVRFVAVDLERDSLTERLAAAGHDPARPTLFVWEGVFMYLTTEAIEATLRALSRLGAEGSVLALSYCVRAGRDPVSAAALSLIGEPIRTRLDPAELAALLARHGFAVTSDAGDREWAQRHGARPGSAGAERITVARRRIGDAGPSVRTSAPGADPP